MSKAKANTNSNSNNVVINMKENCLQSREAVVVDAIKYLASINASLADIINMSVGELLQHVEEVKLAIQAKAEAEAKAKAEAEAKAKAEAEIRERLRVLAEKQAGLKQEAVMSAMELALPTRKHGNVRRNEIKMAVANMLLPKQEHVIPDDKNGTRSSYIGAIKDFIALADSMLQDNILLRMLEQLTQED